MVGLKKFYHAGPFEIRDKCQGNVSTKNLNKCFSNEDYDKSEEKKLKEYLALRKSVLDRATKMEAAKKMESFHKVYKFPKEATGDSIWKPQVLKMTGESIWKPNSPERTSDESLRPNSDSDRTLSTTLRDFDGKLERAFNHLKYSDRSSNDFDLKWERAFNQEKDFSLPSINHNLKYVPLTCENVSRFGEENLLKTNDRERSIRFQSNETCNKDSLDSGIALSQQNSRSQSNIEVTEPKSSTSRVLVESLQSDLDKNLNLIFKELMLLKSKRNVKQNTDEHSSSQESDVNRFDAYSQSCMFNTSFEQN